jgi:hypothetical protein
VTFTTHTAIARTHPVEGPLTDDPRRPTGTGVCVSRTDQSRTDEEGNDVPDHRSATARRFRPGLEGHIAFRTRIAEPDATAGHCATAAWTSRSWPGG